MSDPNVKSFPNGRSLVNGDLDSYEFVQRLDKDGAFGASFEAKRRSDGKNVFVKMPRFDPSYTATQINGRLARVFESLTSEFAGFERLREHEHHFARILDVGIIYIQVNEVPTLLPFLVQDLVHGEDLEQHVERIFSSKGEQFRGLPDGESWFKYASGIAKVVELAHRLTVVHGDIWPPNIMVVPDGEDNVRFMLVDFGQSFLADKAFAGEASEDYPHSYLSPERRSGEKWGMPSDLYALGGVLFFLATGQKPPMLAREKGEQTTQMIREVICDQNPGLFNNSFGVAQVIAKAMAPHRSRRFRTATEIITDLSCFRGDQLEIQDLGKEAVTRVVKRARDIAQSPNRLMRVMAADVYSRFARDIENLSTGLHEVTGDRELIVDTLLQFLSVLDDGDEYITVTTPNYWSSENLGVDGRFIELCKALCARGVKVRRLFLATFDEMEGDHWKKIVRNHLRIADELGEWNSAGALEARNRLSVFYRAFESEVLRGETIDRVEFVGFWRKDEQFMGIKFYEDEDGKRLNKLSVWCPSPEVGARYLQRMQALFEGATAFSRDLISSVGVKVGVKLNDEY